MKLHELTKEQQDFAEANHNLVHAFLRKKQLRADDYYDVIVFGYLRAVQKYLLRDDLRNLYAFSTVAWSAMECDLGNHRKKTSPARHVRTVSFEAASHESAMPGTADIISAGNRLPEQLEASLLWEEIENTLPQNCIAALRMRMDGYGNREIAAAQKRPLADIETMLSDALASVRAMCLV